MSNKIGAEQSKPVMKKKVFIRLSHFRLLSKKALAAAVLLALCYYN